MKVELRLLLNDDVHLTLHSAALIESFPDVQMQGIEVCGKPEAIVLLHVVKSMCDMAWEGNKETLEALG